MIRLKSLFEKADSRTEEAGNRFLEVASTEDVIPGKGKVVVVMGREIGLFNVEGQIEAIDNTCPHSVRPIGNVEFNGHMVTCLWHGLKFNVVNGECPQAPHYKAKKYPVRVEGDRIFVGL